MVVAFDRQRSVPKQVYELLREKILTVELKPGESINERGLADWLGVSRTPIREAIKRLADAGLIRIIPNVGTSVALISAPKARELSLIRVSLESAAVRVAAEVFNPTIDRHLSDTIVWLRESGAALNIKRNIAVDNEFHRTIVESAGFTTMWSILQSVTSEILRVGHLSAMLPGGKDVTVSEHSEIINALRARDADRAERAMSRHLATSYELIQRAITANPQYVEDVPAIVPRPTHGSVWDRRGVAGLRPDPT